MDKKGKKTLYVDLIKDDWECISTVMDCREAEGFARISLETGITQGKKFFRYCDRRQVRPNGAADSSDAASFKWTATAATSTDKYGAVN